MTARAGVKIEPWRDGAAFRVKAHAGARRDGVAGVHDGMLKVEVAAAPEKGRANRAIALLLARALGVAAADIELLAGETNSRKRFGVRGVSVEELEGKVEALL